MEKKATQDEIDKVARKIKKLRCSTQNHINNGGSFNTERYANLQDQFDKIAAMNGFSKALEQLEWHYDTNLGDLAC